MKRTVIMKCNNGCSHKVTADTGETFHTEIDGTPYVLRTRGGDTYELIPSGPIHVGRVKPLDV